MLLTVRFTDRDCGNHSTIVEPPYAEALAVIDGLINATDDATYRGVRFGGTLRDKLVSGFRSLKVDHASSAWAAIVATGEGPYEFDAAYLASILACAAKIEASIASATTPRPTYQCAASRDGCRARVARRGDYCRRCQHDE